MNLSIQTLKEIINSAIAGVPFASLNDVHDNVVTVSISHGEDSEHLVDINYALYAGKQKGVVWSRELINAETNGSLGLFPADTSHLIGEEELVALKRNTMWVRRTIAAAIKADGYWIIKHSRKFTMGGYANPAVAAVVESAPAVEGAPDVTFVPLQSIRDVLGNIASQLVALANRL